MSIDRPEGMSEIETLLKKNNIKNYQKWSPYAITKFRNALSNGAYSGMPSSLSSNIAYSLQYLQYIQLQIEEMDLHVVVYTQLCKSYVVISMGIIEGVFYHLLKSNGEYNKEEWNEIGKVTTNEFNDNGITKKHIIYTHQKLTTPKDGKMDFGSMIAKVRSKNLIKLSQNVYPYIKDLKEIRNKVHLHIGKNNSDTDYHKLGYIEYNLARYTLYKILSNEVFEPMPMIFDWIKPSNEILSQIKPILEQRRKIKQNE